MTCLAVVKLGGGTQKSCPEPRLAARIASGTQHAATTATASASGRTRSRNQSSATSWAGSTSTASSPAYTAATVSTTYAIHAPGERSLWSAITSARNEPAINATISAYPLASCPQYTSGRLTAVSSPAASATHQPNSLSPIRPARHTVALAPTTLGSRITSAPFPNAAIRA